MKSHVWRHWSSALYALLMAVAASSVSTTVMADDWPQILPGKWQIKEDRDGERSATLECSDPIGKLKESVAALETKGCKRTPVKRIGSDYRFETNCPAEDPSGNMARLIGTFTLTAQGASAFRMQTKSNIGDVSRSVRVEAKRIGDCKVEPSAPTGGVRGQTQSR